MEKQLEDIVAGKLYLNIVYRKAEIDGGFIAECLELPGCMSQGDTEDEVKSNIVDAIESCVSVLLEDAIKANMIDRVTDISDVVKSERIVLDPQVRDVA